MQTANSGIGPGSPLSSAEPPFSDILKQMIFESPEKIKEIDTGRQIAQKLYNIQTASETDLNYFRARAFKWIEVLKWATGRQEMRQFLDYFNISDGNKAYVKIDMSPNMLGVKFATTLVDFLCGNEEYPCVTAIDEQSKGEKEKRKQRALFRMRHPQQIDQIQQASGMILEQPNAYVPDDELAAEMHFELEDRLPVEIEQERTLEEKMSDMKYDRIMKRKTINDLVIHNFGITKIERSSGDKYCVRIPVTQNMFYNYFTGDSGSHELGYIGEMYSLRIRDLRLKYGQSPDNPKGLSENDLYEFAKMSTQRNAGWFAFTWREEYSIYNFNRPWDDYSVYVMDFEINISMSDYYVDKVDNFGKSNITPKNGIPQPTSDKATVLKKNKNRWYHGIYAPFNHKMIYWGLPDWVILDFNNIEQSYSSYTVNIPFNNGEYVPSLFERAMEPLREYTITKLKRKQLIAKLRPSGVRIDVEAARNLDLGNGNTIDWEEVVRIFDQTGNELYNSRSVDPLQKEGPAITNTAVDEAVAKIAAMTQTMQQQVMEIRDILGVSLYLDGSTVGDRTPGKLADAQSESGQNVTDFIPNANNQLWEETFHKITLIEWQKKVKKAKPDDPIINTVFKTEVKMKSTAYEKQMMESYIQTALQEGQISLKDALHVREIKNFKLQQLYLSAIIEKNKKEAAQQQQATIQQNAQAQQQSAQQSAQNESQIQMAKQQAEAAIKDRELRGQKELEIITGLFAIWGKGLQMPEELKPLAEQALANVMAPIVAENKEMQMALLQQQSQMDMAHAYAAQQGQQDNPSQQQIAPPQAPPIQAPPQQPQQAT